MKKQKIYAKIKLYIGDNIVILLSFKKERKLLEETNNLNIGVFDSGMGGVSVLGDLIKLMPNENYIYYGDSRNAPYGTKNVNEIIEHTKNACDFLISKGVKAIVIACNTATSCAIEILRKEYSIPIIGMEPAVKPAIELADNKKVIVLATPVTLGLDKFNTLIEQLNCKERIIKIPAPELVNFVEKGDINSNDIRNQILSYLHNIDLKEVGAIVLGCTHFVFLKDIIRNIIGDEIKIIDGNEGTAKHLKSLLNTSGILKSNTEPSVEFNNSSDNYEMIELSEKLLNNINNYNAKRSLNVI